MGKLRHQVIQKTDSSVHTSLLYPLHEHGACHTPDWDTAGRVDGHGPGLLTELHHLGEDSHPLLASVSFSYKMGIIKPPHPMSVK